MNNYLRPHNLNLQLDTKGEVGLRDKTVMLLQEGRDVDRQRGRQETPVV